LTEKMAFLTAISGSSFGNRYEIEKEETVLGRHPECDVTIDVGAVSRQHAKVHMREGQYEIADLKSRNGTFLNGELLEQPATLKDGDLIRICDIEFSFHSDQPANIDSELLAGPGVDQDQSSFGVVMIDDDAHLSSSREFSSRLDIRGSKYGSQLTTNAEVRLSAMLEIATALGGAVKLEEVLPKVLETLFRVFLQADRAFIVLAEGDDLIPRWFKTRQQGDEESMRISRTVMREVMDTKSAIISMDASNDSRFDTAVSIADFKIRSIIVAPLLDSEDNAIGALQLDTLDSKRRFEPADLDVLAGVATQAGVAIENAQLHEQAVLQQKIEQDLELASNVQKALLPQDKPDLSGYEFYDYYHPADQIGGDYFDYIELSDGRLVVIVADVAGHGVAAAMFMAKLSAETKFLLASEASPSVAITKLNQRLYALGVEKFVTFICCILEPSTGQVEIVNAGHMAPIWLKPGGAVSEPGDEAAGVPINVVGSFEYESAMIQIEPGDRLVLYTDGINEAPDKQGKMFGIRQLQELVSAGKGTLAEIGDHIVSDVKRFIEGTAQADDMCLVVLGRK
ncbi:MAG: SpoIIE family protein phosphatase, partial [Planctomycetota bacterium]